MSAMLKSGDSFIDVGFNLGICSLLACMLVGVEGAVHCFEPNSVANGIIRCHSTRNDLRNVLRHEIALGDAEGEATLAVVGRHTGTVSLRGRDGYRGRYQTYRIPVTVGSEM